MSPVKNRNYRAYSIRFFIEKKTKLDLIKMVLSTFYEKVTKKYFGTIFRDLKFVYSNVFIK